MSAFHEGSGDPFGFIGPRNPSTPQQKLDVALFSAISAATDAVIHHTTHEQRVANIKTWGGLVRVVAVTDPELAKTYARIGLRNGSLRSEAESIFPELKGTFKPRPYRSSALAAG